MSGSQPRWSATITYAFSEKKLCLLEERPKNTSKIRVILFNPIIKAGEYRFTRDGEMYTYFIHPDDREILWPGTYLYTTSPVRAD